MRTLLIAASILTTVLALRNGLAITPQMGWNTWNSFGCAISEDIVLSSAELIVKWGFKDLGYEYVIIDDCWSAGRNSTGHLQANSTKFPNGIADVASKVHAMGLKLGIYSDAGNFTCGGYEGSLGHEEIDAQTWASWGVDYLKYDNCNNDGQMGTAQATASRYKVMQRALNATGRPILYSMCNWGDDAVWVWGSTVANSWRMAGDVFDMFDRPDPRCPCDEYTYLTCTESGFYCSVMNVVNKVAQIISKGGPGNWNDMDMLQIGNGGMQDSEYKIQMSVWAAAKSPMIMGNDLRKMDANTLSILQNTAVLSVSQDVKGSGAERSWRYFVPDQDKYGQGEIALWVGGLNGPGQYGDQLVLFTNTGTQDRRMNASLATIFFDSGPEGSAPQIKESWEVYDLWANRMDNATANAIINGNGTVPSDARWNATANGGYAGLPSSTEKALMGTKVGTIQPGGTLWADVKGRDVGMFRLRQVGAGKKKRDEL
ncbi:alpha-galactosidase/alpha-n-acetylgalactosaminidase [Rhizodiscina lignyota]|uniref:Alpha-galactosidase n=1 Tax=Rhizodiscina lignyota TaxID=1504668 RepID=A0A9P4IAM5_9PEZI|nr:alpha-galactosidase/alpha-n-acetylgalactosaminidase [Rhizodiscina lignyota]